VKCLDDHSTLNLFEDLLLCRNPVSARNRVSGLYLIGAHTAIDDHSTLNLFEDLVNNISNFWDSDETQKSRHPHSNNLINSL
jgi:hypothetical protein